jgi:hypothetical protein
LKRLEQINAIIKSFSKLPLLLVLLLTLASCSVSNYAMRSPHYRIDFRGDDFEFSEQVVAEAKSVRVLGVDWKRLFKWDGGSAASDRFSDNFGQEGSVGFAGAQAVVDLAGESGIPLISLFNIPSIPVIGNQQKGRVSAYALYTLMKENPGYDFVIYPQFETDRFFVPIFYSRRSVKVTGRLGQIK